MALARRRCARCRSAPTTRPVSHAMAMAFGVAERGWRGKRGRPSTYGALVAMLRAIVRRQVGRPSESLFKALDKADRAVVEAKAWLEGHEAKPQQPQDGAQ